MKIFLFYLLLNSSNYENLGEPRFEGALGVVMASMAIFMLFVLPSYWLWNGIWANYPPYLRAPYRQFLRELPFYRRLQPKQKKSFERKVQRFINQKQFISRSKGLRIDHRKKVLIAGTAIELTFGFKRFDFAHFDKILVYSNDYYSKISKRYHRGEVDLRGYIVLSWAAFEEGNANRSDGINLGVHELAHAVKLENKITNRNYRFISKPDYRLFHNAYKAFAATADEPGALLRSYGKTNIHEFFAVCCENFIERPQEFEDQMPELYALMCKMLRMNPLRI